MRTREGVGFEKAYSEGSTLLLDHLRGKPECRDLVSELLNSNSSNGGPTSSISADATEGKLPSDRRN